MLALAGVLGAAPWSAEADDAGATYLYLHDKGDASIHGFAVQGAVVAPLAGSPFGEPGNPSVSDSQCQTIAYAPSGHFLFTSCLEGVNAYAVQADGSLSSVAGSPFAAGAGNCQGIGVVENKRGLAVYVLSRTDTAIHGFTADGDGVLTAISGSPFTLATNNAYGITVVGNAVFVPGYGDSTFESYRVGKDFALTRTSSTAVGARNYFSMADPKGKFVFSNSYAQDSDLVYSFKVSKASGKFTPVKGSPFAMGEFADLGGDILVGTGGRAVGLSYGGETVQAMSYDKKGRLLALGGVQDLDLPGNKVGVFLPGPNALCIASDDAQDLRTFTMDPTTGVLTLADTDELGATSHAFNGIIVVER